MPNNKTSKFTDTITPLAQQLLSWFDVSKPTKKQISYMEILISNTFVNKKLVFNNKLTKQERACLILAAHGRTVTQSAEILKVGSTTVHSHCKAIRRKLGCTTMAQAIFRGIKYGYFNDYGSDSAFIPK